VAPRRGSGRCGGGSRWRSRSKATQPRLDVRAVAVPAEERRTANVVAQIVDARGCGGRRRRRPRAQPPEGRPDALVDDARVRSGDEKALPRGDAPADRAGAYAQAPRSVLGTSGTWRDLPNFERASKSTPSVQSTSAVEAEAPRRSEAHSRQAGQGASRNVAAEAAGPMDRPPRLISGRISASREMTAARRRRWIRKEPRRRHLGTRRSPPEMAREPAATAVIRGGPHGRSKIRPCGSSALRKRRLDRSRTSAPPASSVATKRGRRRAASRRSWRRRRSSRYRQHRPRDATQSRAAPARAGTWRQAAPGRSLA